MERNTTQRRVIRKVIQAAARPVGPQEILEGCQEELPGLGIATVYRAVKSLVDEGWITTVDLPGEPSRYELAKMPHHHHFHCKTCGKVYDIEGCNHDVAHMVPKEFDVESHEIVFYGRCPPCAKPRKK